MSDERQAAMAASRRRYEDAADAFDNAAIAAIRALRAMLDAQADLVTALVMHSDLQDAERIRAEVKRQIASRR